MNAESFDVVIMGGGPAGAASGAYLAMRGHKVLLLEKDRFPRFKIGESLVPSTWDQYDAIGVTPEIEAEQFMKKRGVRFVFGAKRDLLIRPREFPAYFPRGYTLHVERARFDVILLNHAARVGVDVRQEWTAHEVLFEGERAVGVMCGPNGAEPRPIRAKVVIDATGRACHLARRLGWRRPDPALNNTSYYCHFENAYFTRDEDDNSTVLDVHTIDGGWLWYIPLAGGVTSVGAVLTADYIKRMGVHGVEERFQHAVAGSPEIREWMKDARPIMPMQSVSSISYLNHSFVGDGFVMIGDASMFIDPIFSAGVSIALRGGLIAAKFIHDGLCNGDVSADRLKPYEHAIRYPMTKMFGMIYNWYKLIGDSTTKVDFARAIESPWLRERLVILWSGGYDRVDMDRLLEGIDDWQFGLESYQQGLRQLPALATARR